MPNRQPVRGLYMKETVTIMVMVDITTGNVTALGQTQK